MQKLLSILYQTIIYFKFTKSQPIPIKMMLIEPYACRRHVKLFEVNKIDAKDGDVVSVRSLASIFYTDRAPA